MVQGRYQQDVTEMMAQREKDRLQRLQNQQDSNPSSINPQTWESQASQQQQTFLQQQQQQQQSPSPNQSLQVPFDTPMQQLMHQPLPPQPVSQLPPTSKNSSYQGQQFDRDQGKQYDQQDDQQQYGQKYDQQQYGQPGSQYGPQYGQLYGQQYGQQSQGSQSNQGMYGQGFTQKGLTGLRNMHQRSSGGQQPQQQQQQEMGGFDCDYYNKGHTLMLPCENESLIKGVRFLTNLTTTSPDFRNVLFETNTLLRQTLSANLVFASKSEQMLYTQKQGQQGQGQQQYNYGQQGQQGLGGQGLNQQPGFNQQQGLNQQQQGLHQQQQQGFDKPEFGQGFGKRTQGAHQQNDFNEKAFLRLFDYELDDQSRLLLAYQWQDLFRRVHCNQQYVEGIQVLLYLLERECGCGGAHQQQQQQPLQQQQQQQPLTRGSTQQGQPPLQQSSTNQPQQQSLGTNEEEQYFQDNNLRQAISNAKAALEAFAGVTLDKLCQALCDITHRARDDTRFWEQLVILKCFVWHSLNDLNWVESAQFTDMTIAMINRLRLTLQRHKQIVSRALLKANFVLECMRNKQFVQPRRQLKNSQDIFYTDNNRLTLRPAFLDDFRQMFIPLVTSTLRCLKTPNVIGSDETMDYEMENITFQGSAINPDKVRIDTIVIENASIGSQRDTSPIIAVQVGEVTATLQDVKFAYRRKKLPKVDDYGMMELVLGGHGINIDIELKPCLTGEPNRLWSVQRVRCESSKIEIRNMRGEEHSALYGIFKPIIESRVRRAVEQAIEDTIVTIIQQVDNTLIYEHGWQISPNTLAQLRQYQQPSSQQQQQPQSYSMPRSENEPLGRSSNPALGKMSLGQSSNSGIGQSNLGAGQSNLGAGQSNLGAGQSNLSSGQSNVGSTGQSGQSNLGQSTAGQGNIMSPNMGQANMTSPKIAAKHGQSNTGTTTSGQALRDDYPMA